MTGNGSRDSLDIHTEPQVYWHSYGLQHLKTSRFVDVVGHILQGHHTLITPSRRPETGRALLLQQQA